MKREEIDEVVLNYSLCEDRPSVYGIKSRPIKQNELKRPGNRVYAISPDSVTWSKEHEPTAKAGKSIFIYDFRDKR